MKKAIIIITIIGLTAACSRNRDVRGETGAGVTPAGTPRFQAVMDGRTYVLFKDDRLKYYENDALREGVLAENAGITNGAYRFALAAEHPVGFYENGRLEYGWLAGTNDFDGVTFVPGRATFHITGEIADGYVARGETVAGIDSEDNYPVFFYINGNSRLILPEDTVEVGGMKFLGDKLLSFYPNGVIWRGVLAEDTTIGGVVYKKKTSVLFYMSGIVWQGTLAKRTTIGTLDYPADTRVTYDERGRVVNAE